MERDKLSSMAEGSGVPQKQVRGVCTACTCLHQSFQWLHDACLCRKLRRRSSDSDSKRRTDMKRCCAVSHAQVLCSKPAAYRSIAQNYTHIKAVENQLAELQLQLNLTSGPKKSALEMLRKKIEAKNELVAAARQKFAAAAKVRSTTFLTHAICM